MTKIHDKTRQDMIDNINTWKLKGHSPISKMEVQPFGKLKSLVMLDYCTLEYIRDENAPLVQTYQEVMAQFGLLLDNALGERPELLKYHHEEKCPCVECEHIYLENLHRLTGYDDKTGA